MKSKNIPMRQCLGCRAMKPKRELIRAVRSPEGDVSLDFIGKKPGRGAYICGDANCLKRAVKSRALNRAFGVEIPPEVIETLTEEITGSAMSASGAQPPDAV